MSETKQNGKLSTVGLFKPEYAKKERETYRRLPLSEYTIRIEETLKKKARTNESKTRYLLETKEDIEKINNMTPYQHFLYKRLKFGLMVYPPVILQAMTLDRKRTIQNTHRQAIKVLNIWKQEILNLYTNRILYSLFPNSEFTKFFVEDYQNEIDTTFKLDLTFRQLKIKEVAIIEKLIQEKLLPLDFFCIKTPEDFYKERSL